MPPSMSTVSCVAEPSSSTLSEPRRPAMVPLSTTVTLELATGLADQAGEGGGLLAVEVGFEAVAYGFMQQDSGPAGAEHDFHLAGRGGHCAELQDRSARGLAGQVLRAFGADKLIQAARVRRRPPSPWW
jgi:hypothetical protein